MSDVYELLDRVITEVGRTITPELRSDIDAALTARPEPVAFPKPRDFGYRDDGGTWIQQFAYDAQQVRDYVATLIAEQAAEIERLKRRAQVWEQAGRKANEESEAAEAALAGAKAQALREAAAFFEREVQEYAKWSSHTVSTKLRQLASEHEQP